MNSYPVNISGQGYNDDVVTQVDTTHAALRVSLRPMETNQIGVVGGAYRLAARSGALTSATVTATAPLFSFRWSPTSQLYAVISRLRAFYIPTTVFTAAQELGLDAMHATSFTASDSAGTAITAMKMRQNMPGSNATDIRIATTTLLTAGTRTLDAIAFAIGGGVVNIVNAAAATAYINPNSGGTPAYGFDYEGHLGRGEHPLVLGPNEGILVRNTVVFPAAGVATLVVEMAWSEVGNY